MEKIYICSNAGKGVAWWERSKDGIARRTSHSPEAYQELRARRCFTDTNFGLYLYTTSRGTTCCLVDSVPTGRKSGNSVVLQSILIESASNELTLLMKGLAQCYLNGVPIPPDELLWAVSPALGFEKAFELIIPHDGEISVDWEELSRCLISTKLSVGSGFSNCSPSLRVDNPRNRQELAALIAATATIPSSDVFVSVSWGLPVDPSLSSEVSWGLTDRESLGLTEESTPCANEIGPVLLPISNRSNGPSFSSWWLPILLSAGTVAAIALWWRSRSR